MTCQVAFFMIQAHHDYCDHDTLTTEEETLFHLWEASCLNCVISRNYDANLLACPQVNCRDTSVIDAAFWILNSTCTPASSGHDHAHGRALAAEARMRRLNGQHGSGDAIVIEWAGIFPTADTSHNFIL